MSATAAKHDVFQAIADPTRRRILHLLADQEMPVAAITEQFPITRTAINKHLYVLTEAGLVQPQKVGRETRYTLQSEPLSQVQQWIRFFEPYWDDRLKALQAYVEES